MTESLDLDAIQQRHAAATKGRWYYATSYGPHFVASEVSGYERGIGTLNFGDGDDAKADRDFVLDAHEDMGQLLAEIHRLQAENTELIAELDGRDDEARERWITKQLDQTAIRSMEFRNGAHMDLEPARELVAHWVAAARAMLGDAPNYSETKLEFDVKVAESPEMYTLVVQRHAPGALTPHEARQRAEAEAEKLRDELAELKMTPRERANRHVRALLDAGDHEGACAAAEAFEASEAWQATHPQV